ncbi:MAG: ABC transporter ATP-binding protein [Bacillota bacterium]
MVEQAVQNILEMRGITKIFGDVKANDGIDLSVRRGEIHGLLGENGAGKTTLMNILYGLYKPNAGVIFIDGKEAAIEDSLAAIRHGVGMIHQHFMLVPAFTVLENIVLGLRSSREPFLDLKKARNEVAQLAKRHVLTVYPDALISDLSTGLKQQVEIIKMLYRGANILILDEPTGVLTPSEMVELFGTLKSLARQGKSVIIISHKLEEIMEVTDRVSVLRRGRMVAAFNTCETTPAELARQMVGREVVFRVEKKAREPGDVMLEVRDLCVRGMRKASTLKSISFSVREGEIFGIAGVDGNGQTELMEALAGLRRVESGDVFLDGESIANLNPGVIAKKKLAFVPEDRKEMGVVRGFGIDRNMILRNVDAPPVSRHGVIDNQYVRRETDRMIGEYDVRLSYRKTTADQLSGGNLQKIILARELGSVPKVLLAMHPTRGLDVGAIEFIHGKILKARERGAAIVIVSTELEEILMLSDRIAVFFDGNISGILDQKDASVEALGRLMAGITGEAEQEGGGRCAKDHED